MSSDSKKIKYSYLEYITFLNTRNQATVTFLLIIDWVFNLIVIILQTFISI